MEGGEKGHGKEKGEAYRKDLAVVVGLDRPVENLACGNHIGGVQP
jgi:hypothetical protein